MNGQGKKPNQIKKLMRLETQRDLHGRKLGTVLLTPLSYKELKICGLAYVDDTDILASARGQNDPEIIFHKMQEIINCWEGVAKRYRRGNKGRKVLVVFDSLQLDRGWNLDIWTQ